MFTLLLGVCAGLPALSIDLSAPTLTILPAALSTSVAIAGLSLSLFMVGFAIGQFAGGRTSDCAGRRPVLLGSIGVYVLSGICCAIATSGWELVLARLVQGVGAGACAVQAAAMVQDLFQGEAARRKQSYVSVVLTIMPMLAPALGTAFVTHWGWRSVHVVLAIGGALLAIVIALLVDESHRPTPQQKQDARGFGLRDSITILNDAVFLRLTLVNALSYGAIFAYIAGAPVVVMDVLALSSGALTNAALGRRGITSERLVWPGLVGQAGATIALVFAGLSLDAGGAAVAIPALLVGAFARGVLSPNLVHLSVSRHRARAGLASALVGLMQLMVGAFASALVAALLSPFGYNGVALSMAALACAAAIVWRVTEGPERIREIRRAD